MRTSISDYKGENGTMARPKKMAVAYRENPFIGNADISMPFPTRRKWTTVKGGKDIVDRETGIVESTAEITQVRWVDEEEFVKIFTRNLKLFFDLKPSTYKMLQVVLWQLQKIPNEDRILLNMTVTEEYFTQTEQKSMAKTTFHSCINELMGKNFIAQSYYGAGMYFINPHLFFNGDRVKFTQEFRKRKSAKTHREELEAMGQQILALEVPEKEELKLLEAVE